MIVNAEKWLVSCDAVATCTVCSQSCGNTTGAGGDEEQTAWLYRQERVRLERLKAGVLSGL